MKKAYKNYDELLHSWIYADELFEGHTPNNRMFAEGNELYSYRYGAMIAKKLPNQTILIDTRTFSVTTSKQQRLLQRAIPNHWTKIYVEDPKQEPKILIQRSISLIKRYLDKISSATSKKQNYLLDAEFERVNILELVRLYPEAITLKDYQFLEKEFHLKDWIPNYEEYIKKQEKREKEKKRKQEIENQLRLVKGNEQLEKWLNFETNSCYLYSGLTRLRYKEDTEEVQTTQGVNIHKDKVKELYELLKEGKDVIGLKIDNIYTVISLSNNILKIGCHSLDVMQLLLFGNKVFKNEDVC